MVFLYLAFRGTDFVRLVHSLKEANYWWVPVMVLLIVLSILFRSWRWRYFLDPIRPHLGIRNLFSGVMIGYFANNIIPRAGELLRPYVVAKKELMPTSAVLGTVVMERILDMASLLILLISLPLAYDGPLRESFPWLDKTARITAALLGISFSVFILLMIRRDFTSKLIRKMTGLLSPSMSNRIMRIANSFLDGFLFVKRPSTFFGILISSILIWSMYILMQYVAIQAFHLEHVLGLRAAIVILAISSIGVALPTPGATGTYHFFTMQALVRLYNVSGDIGLSYATVTHAVTFITVTIIGAYFFVRDRVGFEQFFSGSLRREK